MQSPSSTSKVAGATGDTGATVFIERILLPYLRDAQNTDGGWGFSRGAASRVEPTAWALLALSELHSNQQTADASARGFSCLEGSQLSDGFWPAVVGQNEGSWVTSLACWALLVRGEAAGQGAARGIEWLLKEKPGDAGLLWRMARRFTGSKRVAPQNPDYFGWSWTPGTASWVEPTAYALIVLDHAMNGGSAGGPVHRLPAGAVTRIEFAEKMLYDRMCPGGGWNCGNPLVYGAAGEPQVGPTAWALLALRKKAARPEVEKSVEWLWMNRGQIRSTESMALTLIALRAHGKNDPALRTALIDLCLNDETLWTVPAAAWTALAMSETSSWYTAQAERGD
ncbi:MAG: hypothetical protein ACRD59_12620 [Candidatus Acidiferrales bacterium]